MNDFKGMCKIPAGKFLMGAEGWGEFEAPVHEVYTDDFYIDKTPVTNKAFAEFIEQTDYVTTAEEKGFAHGYENGERKRIEGLCWKDYFNDERKNHPVVLVSWRDADEFSKWAGKRLPTEAEWEKAARGGLEQKIYPWGNDEPNNSICNFAKETNDFPATTTIKSFAPNNYNVYDMAGNVWNWCSDWFSENYYSNMNNNKNPEGAENGITKVRRGASFNIIQPFRLRCANRGAYKPDNYAINIGFRCVKDVKLDEQEMQVQEILKTLQPAMEADGGGVDLVSVKNGIVKVKFKDACLLCPSIGMTLKYGVFKTLKDNLPWVKNVINTNN